MLRWISWWFLTAVLACPAFANPWKVQEGSTLLDGRETATYVAGYLFSGKEYEFTSAQLNLRCVDEELIMNVVGDGDLLTKAKAESNVTIEFPIKVADQLVTFVASIENVDFGRQSARVHNGPELLEFLRQKDGGTAQIQLPVASTGVPEVRSLSLEKLKETTDIVLATCGPIRAWNGPEKTTVLPDAADTTKGEEEPIDLQTALSIGLAQQMVEQLIKNQDVSLEQFISALEPLTKISGQ